ncbi:MAG: right-handed parallel beta-helix repeat-containing protein [Ahniella sp.]|nr:right-handed parallel beta-helix repeat-containing protein [Ahniella sp.]
MRKILGTLMLVSLALTSSSVFAQATRTWVSGVGDDANPCSRTAPCKTFAGAISKTAARGKINVLDPGGFGAVTITKSITIEADGAPAGVLVSGTNGIIINAAATDMVTLRNIKIEGIGTGLNGIRILAAGTVLIDGCVIEDFADNGVLIENTGASKVVIRNSVVRRSGNTAVKGLIRATPATGASSDVTIDGSTLFASGNGLVIGGNVRFRLRDSSLTGGVNDGVVLLNVTGTRSGFIDNAMISDFDGSGIAAYGAGSTVR